jgi:uncharacterized protein (TIGR02588 family)
MTTKGSKQGTGKRKRAGKGGGSGGGTTEAQERARLVVGIASLVLVLAFVATCWWVERSRGSAPAYVRVVSVERATHGRGETFTATVENTGDTTAEQVLVRGTVGDADPVDHEIDFLAPGEQDELTLKAPPGTKRSDVEVRVHAWTDAH